LEITEIERYAEELKPHTEDLAAEKQKYQRKIRDLPGLGYFHRSIVSGDVGYSERTIDP